MGWVPSAVKALIPPDRMRRLGIEVGGRFGLFWGVLCLYTVKLVSCMPRGEVEERERVCDLQRKLLLFLFFVNSLCCVESTSF